jgi:hypothetical protein
MKRKREIVVFEATEFVPHSHARHSNTYVSVTCSFGYSQKCCRRVIRRYGRIMDVWELRGGCYACNSCAKTSTGQAQKRRASSTLGVEEFVLGTHSKGSTALTRATCSSGQSKKCVGKYVGLYKNIALTCGRNEGHYICQACSNKSKLSARRGPNVRYDIDEDLLRDINGQFAAYLLGWIASDGTFQKNGAITISIHEKDIHVLEQLRDGLCADLPIRSAGEGMVRLDICSKKMNADGRHWLGLSHFTEGGSWKKSHCLLFPNLPDDSLKWHFLRGYSCRPIYSDTCCLY